MCSCLKGIIFMELKYDELQQEEGFGFAEVLVDIIGITGYLVYFTEEITPEKTDSRKPLLPPFGNPALQSAIEEMFFAGEGKGKEHRIWN